MERRFGDLFRMGLSRKQKANFNFAKDYLDKDQVKDFKYLLKKDFVGVSFKNIGLSREFFPDVSWPHIDLATDDKEVKVMVTGWNIKIEERAKHSAFRSFAKVAESKIKALIAPNIVGLDNAKEGSLLQLFALDPVHILLLGDPGTGKCVSYDSEVLSSTGEIYQIGDFVESFLLQQGEASMNKKIQLQSLNKSLKVENSSSLKIWRKKSPKFLFKIETESGEQIKVTPTHPFLTIRNGKLQWVEAQDIKTGDFLAKPRILRIKGTSQSLENKIKVSKTNGKKIILPKKTSLSLMKLIGYLISEGNLNVNKGSSTIRFYSNDLELKRDYKRALKTLFSNLKTNEYSYDKIAVYTPSVELARYLDSFDGQILGHSSKRTLPSIFFKCSDLEVSTLLAAIFDSEAHLSKIRLNIELTSASKKFLRQIQYMLLRFGIVSNIHPRQGRATNVAKPKYRTYYRLMIYGKSNFQKFKKNIKLVCNRKRQVINWLVDREYVENTNRDVVPNLAPIFLETRKALGLFQRECGFKGRLQKYENGTRNISRSRLKNVVKAFEAKFKNFNSQNNKIKRNIMLLKTLSKSDIYWTKIVKKNKIKSDKKWVYDLTVPKNRNFICENLIIHNTEILRAVNELAPISSYGLGSGTTGAGLTITKEGKDIHKGLLPMADEGIACIDELNLLKKEDRGSLYNAMEKGFVTYDKGSTHVRYDSRIRLLATANPEGDRFVGKAISLLKKQMPFDPALLSRFHLIFFIRRPTTERFLKIAKKIVSADTKKKHFPDFEFVKEYIAFSEQLDVDFDKSLEKQVLDFVEGIKADEDKFLIDITPRFVVGIIRLTKASARLRLSAKVNEADVDKVLKLVKESVYFK